MRTRVVSSFGVVAVGLVPAILGGPVFAAMMVLLGVVGYREFGELIRHLPGFPAVLSTGYVAIAALAVTALMGWPVPVVVGICMLIVMAPLVVVFGRAGQAGVAEGWAMTASGSFYLGLPIFAAIALRGETGDVDDTWLAQVAEVSAVAWPASPRGLAWLLVAIVVTWISDSAAYLVGRSFGRTRLAPTISPNKTVEGALGGLVGGIVTSVVLDVLFGLGLGSILAALVGVLLAVVGQAGDLGESLLKRQAAVKDSGGLIPGHGGILDRIDSLLLVLPLTWFLAWLIDGAAV